MTHGFPNQFYMGYIQGGLNATVTRQLGGQGEHIAHIIAEALRRLLTHGDGILFRTIYPSSEISGSDFYLNPTAHRV